MADSKSKYSLSWAYAYGQPPCHGQFRTTPEDFQVDENLGFELDGHGQHVVLHVCKRNTNTEWLARQLAEFAGVEKMAVGYAGLKDRNAVTTQYFSINLQGKTEPDWGALNSEMINVLSVTRHRTKLSRGQLRENHFSLTLRDLTGKCDEIEERLQYIMNDGVPNYFGEQRFGHNVNNLHKVEQLFRNELKSIDHHKRGLYISAARSWLFNKVLSLRVTKGNWLEAVPGEALIQRHSKSSLSLRQITPEIEERINKGFLQPSAPLWGSGAPASSLEARAIEDEALQDEVLFKNGLEKAGLEQERRALRLAVTDLRWQWLSDTSLRLQFVLPKGSYATAVLREIAVLTDANKEAIK